MDTPFESPTTDSAQTLTAETSENPHMTFDISLITIFVMLMIYMIFEA
jgi:hypothetical protein